MERLIAGTAEGRRVETSDRATEQWWVWGPYLSERQWGTVREDYSRDGAAWEYFPHDHARARAYRWGEDGIAGLSDHHQYLCFALALWNGRDPILKERLFGLAGPEGNHGEDVKEYYFYVDATPTHSYLRYLYKYPQAAFPYAELVEENRRRGRDATEFELVDTGVFRESRYFDVWVEYAKITPHDVCIRITAYNRGPDDHPLHLIPTLWFRNTWSWDPGASAPEHTPSIRARSPAAAGDLRGARAESVLEATHRRPGGRRPLRPYWLYCQRPDEFLFTNNDTNRVRVFGEATANAARYVKDAFHDYLVGGRLEAVSPECVGTKAGVHYKLVVPAGGRVEVRLRLSDQKDLQSALGEVYDQTFAARSREADEFYQAVCSPTASEDSRAVQRQAFAGMIWNKQFYHYVADDWLGGDATAPPPPSERKRGRNSQWRHFWARDILSMPDKWEYPWFAAWDLAFHTVPLAVVDPGFAKRQLYLLAREWFMHPNGQLPAYEWAFDDANPPVQAWATYKVYQIERARYGRADTDFLERMFQRLLLYFTSWINRKDAHGRNIFQGGFLGLDNISVIDRSNFRLDGSRLDQADATGWMAMFCLNMLRIAVELGHKKDSYRQLASKFLQHFLLIARAMALVGGEAGDLWDERDGFFYDLLSQGRVTRPLKVRSVVGLVPLFAAEFLELTWQAPGTAAGFADSGGFSDLADQVDWFASNYPDLIKGDYLNVARVTETGGGKSPRVFLSVVDERRLRTILRYVLDEAEFLGSHGVRSLSRQHRDQPVKVEIGGCRYEVTYEPAESRSMMFGGNSNWRGPVWMPINYLLIESLRKYHQFLGDSFKIECPTGSGRLMTLAEVGDELARRIISTFQRDDKGRRPVNGGMDLLNSDPHWRDLILFYEYFHGDNGAGIGASHQTGWTGLVAELIT